MITSAYAEVPSSGHVLVNPGDRRLKVDRVIALPELFGPDVRGLPGAENGFIPSTCTGGCAASSGVFAAGDATDFAVKQGGISSQQADAAAQAIAALAGVAIEPEPFRPDHPRHPADRRAAEVPDSADHGRARLQLGDHRRAELVAAGQDLGALPRALPGRARPRGRRCRALRLRARRADARGVLTGGGDCPGLNAVIRGLVRRGSLDGSTSSAAFAMAGRGCWSRTRSS